MGVSGRGLFGADLFGIGNKLSWSGSYGYVNATYDSNLELVADANTSRSYSTTSYNSFDDDDLIGDDGAKETLEGLWDAFDSTYLRSRRHCYKRCRH